MWMGRYPCIKSGFSTILDSVLVACNNHFFLMHWSRVDYKGFGFRLWVGSRFAQCAPHVILIVDGKLTKTVSRNTWCFRS